jgi:hypothetical protein
MREGHLRRRVQKLPAEYQYAMVKEGLVNRREGGVIERMLKIDSPYLSANRSCKSLDVNMCLHSTASVTSTNRQAMSG